MRSRAPHTPTCVAERMARCAQGDVSATAFNTGEQIVCSLVMIGSGMLWGYLVGAFCNLATASPSVRAFRDELSQLNGYMEAYALDADLRFRLREFLHETIHLRNAEARSKLLGKLSPAMQVHAHYVHTHIPARHPSLYLSLRCGPHTHTQDRARAHTFTSFAPLSAALVAHTAIIPRDAHGDALLPRTPRRTHRELSTPLQGEVSLLVNQRWVSKVWYLRRGAQLELLIEIASRLKAQVFAPWEFCPSSTMYIVNRGTALFGGKPKHAGSCWGEDILLPGPQLQLDFSAVAISYLWVFTIDGANLHAAISTFPQSATRLRRIARPTGSHMMPSVR